MTSSALPAHSRWAITIFQTYICFVVAGMVLNGANDDTPYVPLNQGWGVAGIAWKAIEVGSLVSLLAVLTGGAPIGFAVLRYAMRNGRRDILLRLATPLFVLLGLGMAFGSIVLIAVVIPHQPNIGLGRSLFVVFFGLFVLGAVASTQGVISAVRLSDIAPELYTFARRPAQVLLGSMVEMTLAAIVWGIAIQQRVGFSLDDTNGIFGSPGIFSLVGVVGVMAAVSIVGLRAMAQSRAALGLKR